MNIVFSPTYRSINPAWADQAFTIGETQIPYSGLLGLVLGVGMVGVVGWILYRTETGTEIRAIAEDPKSAGIIGINVQHKYALTFGIGAAFTGAAGVLLAVTSTVSPLAEAIWTLYAFVVVVIGGVGRPLSAIIGGLSIGLVNAYVSLFLDPSWGNVAIFVLLVVVLFVKPTGVLGELGGGAST